MPYHPPYEPHEIDLLPDGIRQRVIATLNKCKEDHQKEADDLPAQSIIDELERELEHAEEENCELNERIGELESQLEDDE